MPYSSGVFDIDVENLICAMQPRTVLDIGAGAGKYGHLVKRASPGTHVTAVELDLEYIERFKLREIYDVIISADAETLMRQVDADYDVVILGDVIEHLRKSTGLDLLNFLVYRTRRIVVVFPLRYRQGAVDGRNQEAHISVWGQSDFHWCDASYRESNGFALVQIAGFIG
jgi:SAM-dependent methyltransferase